MAVGFDGELELRAHAVGARHEHGPSGLGRHAEHAAKTAERPAGPGGARGFDQSSQPALRVFGDGDVHTGAGIVERHASPRHASSSAWNDTNRWHSPTRDAMFAGVTSTSRSTENFSTANEPSAQP